MSRTRWFLIPAVVLAAIALGPYGCTNLDVALLSDDLFGDSVVLRIENDTTATLKLAIAYHDNPEIGRDDMIILGKTIKKTMSPGTQDSAVLPCESAASITLADAHMDLTSNVGLDKDDPVILLRIDDDFACGDIIRFRFVSDHQRTDLGVAAEAITPKRPDDKKEEEESA